MYPEDDEERPLWKIHAQGILTSLPFHGRVRYLWENPGLSNKPLGKDRWGMKVHPNCHGTTLFVLGAERFVGGEQYNDFNQINYILKEGRPGYVDPEVMSNILKNNLEQTDWPTRGGIVAVIGSWNNNGKESKSAVHSAIFSCFANGEQAIFQQRAIKQKFEISTVEKYLRVHRRFYQSCKVSVQYYKLNGR